jgi:hypothetical protein
LILHAEQLDLLGPAPDLPQGLTYRAELLTKSEERNWWRGLQPFHSHLSSFTDLKEAPHRFVRLAISLRRVGPGRGGADADWLLVVREKPQPLRASRRTISSTPLIIEYSEGAGIGWHRDRPDFGEVIGISLKSEAPLRFRLKESGRWRRLTLAAAPRSAYHLAGPVREQWEHSILAVPALRYSITLRTLRPR